MDAYKSQKPWKIIDTKIKQGMYIEYYLNFFRINQTYMNHFCD